MLIPSPKFHNHDEAPVDKSVKLTFRGAQPDVGVAEKLAWPELLRENKHKNVAKEKRKVLFFMITVLNGIILGNGQIAF